MNDVLVGSLLTWRISSLLVTEEGPFDIFERLRESAGVSLNEYSQCRGQTEVAQALCCMWCTSLWVGLVVALIRHHNPLYGFIYSAGAIWLSVRINNG